jgi:hypothetical protein
MARCRKKPCSVCRRWFQPNPRVGERQRTCGSADCRRAHKRRTQRAWVERHPDYWTEQRLAAQAERAVAARGPPPEVRRLPLAFAQDAMGAQALVFVLLLARLQHRALQDAMRAQHAEFTSELARLGVGAAQDAMEAERRPP